MVAKLTPREASEIMFRNPKYRAVLVKFAVAIQAGGEARDVAHSLLRSNDIVLTELYKERKKEEQAK